MLIYIVLLIISLSLAFTENKKNKTIHGFIIMFIMLMVCGLRDKSVGIDTIGYINIFKDRIYTDISTGEKLFFSTYKLIDKLGGSENVWLFIVSSLIYIPLFYIVKDYSPLPALSMLIYMISTSSFFPESMNIIRQSIAIVFILIAYIFWNNDKKILSFLSIVIATFFHMSSLIAIPFLLLKFVKFNKKVIVISLLIALIVGVSQFGKFINDYIAGLSMIFSDRNEFSENLMKYSEFSDSFNIMNWRGVIFRISPLIFLCLITVPNNKNSFKYRFYYNIMFIATIFYCFLSTVPFGFRIVLSQMIVQILVIPFAYFYGSHKQRYWIIIYLLLLVLLYIYYLYNISQQKTDLNNIIPFKFFFNT